MNVGIIGAGRIAATLAATMQKTKGVDLFAVASRSEQKAKEFAARFKAKKFYSSYEALVKDGGVDLVYIATPHSFHAEQAELCVTNGKAVLCEKAFALNRAQAERVLSLAKEKNVFVSEAMWTRYMPSRKMINDLIASGIVGEVKALTANLSYEMTKKERLVKPELAGGALLDVGVYALNFASMHFGNDIERVESSARLLPNGLDEVESVALYYKDGKAAFLNSGLNARSDRKGIFYGQKGYIVVENINNPQSASAFDSNDRLLKKIKFPRQITGYEYELLECADCLARGKTESDSMPHSETLLMMERMDALRKSWGVSYPGE